MSTPLLPQCLGLEKTTGGIATILVGSIKVAFTLISLSIVDTVGRRTLLLTGAVGMAFSLLALSAAFDQGQNETLTRTQTTVALVSVCSAVAFYSLGFGPITWLVVSELFPDEIRGRTLGAEQRVLTGQPAVTVAVALQAC